jgi:serine/threonine protein phosphatase 1
MRWVIGDIHGMLKPLRVLLDAVRAADESPRFYFLGDFFNRGPDSQGVIDLLLKLENAQFVRGNHDDFLDGVINGHAFTVEEAIEHPAEALADFMVNGVAETFRSYGASRVTLATFARRPLMSRLARLRRLVPPAHQRFLRELPLVIEEDDLFIAHAMWLTGEPTTSPGMEHRLERDEQARRQLLWGRFTAEDIVAPKAWRRTGYFGHTPVVNYGALCNDGVPLPVVGPQIVLLDTGAFAPEGRLTGWCADNRRYLQVRHDGTAVKG